MARDLPPPLSQLLPRLDKLLDGSRRGKRAAVHDPAVAVSTLVEVQDGGLAQAGKALVQRFDVFGAHRVFASAEVRSPGHSRRMLPRRKKSEHGKM